MDVRRAGAMMAAFAALGLAIPAAGAAAQEPVPDLSRELQLARQTMTSEPVRNAFAYLERSRDETVQEWLSLCNAYGPSGDEIYRSRLLYKLFRIYGLDDVRIDHLRNVIGVRRGRSGRAAGGNAPTVVLNAHHDAVALWPKEQPIEAFVADNRVWCPSGGDDLGGVVQLLTVLRALNAANIQTQGDVWFTTFTGEEPAREYASPGSGFFVVSNYPHNVDWRKGDIIVQFHGGGGGGVSTGSTPARHRTMLRVFVPVQTNRWGPHAIDALGPILTRLATLRDPRAAAAGPGEGGDAGPFSRDSAVLFMNFPLVEASEIVNSPAREVRIRFDLRSESETVLQRTHANIQRVAAEVTRQLGPQYSYVYEIGNKNGVGLDVSQNAIEGWDKVNNAPARALAAAAQVLYGGQPEIAWRDGCGDCVRAYREGMPMFSFRGNVVDRGGGRIERSGGTPLRSETRRVSTGHDVTESADIDRLWAGVKHAVLFAVTYGGMAQ